MSKGCKQFYYPKHLIPTKFHSIKLDNSSGDKLTTNFNTVIYPSLPIKSIKTNSSLYNYLPQTFNLKEYGDISSRYDFGSESLLYPIVKQHSCGSCWAWSVVAMLSDRYALAYNKPNPKISPTGIISGIYCMMKRSSEIDLFDACDGGSSYDALILITDITKSDVPLLCDPLVSSSKDDVRKLFKTLDCDNYDWCDKNPKCNKSLLYKESNKHLLDQFSKEGDLNSIVPDYSSKCQKYIVKDDTGEVTILPSYTNNNIEIKIKRCYALEDIESIKYSLFTKGTVITNFVIYPDLIYKPDANKTYWGETDNVYIHKKGCSIYDLGEESYNNDELLGYHSATLVGWGQQKFNRKKLFAQLKVPFKDGDPEDITINYWIGRNTWGDTWNGNGYFKVAFTDKNLGINVEVGVDVPIKLHINACYMPCDRPCDNPDNSCQTVPFGGCCAADLEIEGVTEDDTVEENSKYYVSNNKIVSKFAKVENVSINLSKQSIYSRIATKVLDNKIQSLLLLVLIIILVVIVYKRVVRRV